MRVRVTFALASGCAIALAVACGETLQTAEEGADGGSEASTSSDAGPDGDLADASSDVALDAGVHRVQPCPRPFPPSCAPSVCGQRVLYRPADGGVEFPFSLAMDSTNVFFTTMSAVELNDKPYDGLGTSKIMRVDRSGVDAGGQAVTLAEGQRRALAIATVGDYVYWVTVDPGPAQLRRVRRDCTPPCNVQPVVMLGSYSVHNLVAVDDDTLVGADEDGNVHVVDLAATPPEVKTSTRTSDYPYVAASSNAVVASGADLAEVKILPRPTFTVATFGSVPDAGNDSGHTIGFSPLATDCKDVYGYRGFGSMWKIGEDGGTATYFTDVALNGLFGMITDQSFLYLAGADGAGARAVSLTSGVSQTIQAGNVHRIAVDDKGVYWGDHDRNSGGAIWMMVK